MLSISEAREADAAPIDIAALLIGTQVESERVEFKEGSNLEAVAHMLFSFAKGPGQPNSFIQKPRKL
jgi:hypothetical protein